MLESVLPDDMEEARPETTPEGMLKSGVEPLSLPARDVGRLAPWGDVTPMVGAAPLHGREASAME